MENFIKFSAFNKYNDIFGREPYFYSLHRSIPLICENSSQIVNHLKTAI